MKELSELRILIVDDVADNIDVLVGALRGEHRLSVARDGESALRIAAENPPDLVLLDIMMPGMDGYEVCRRLRASEATREIPVMFLSALEDVANKARGFEIGGNDYLTKPFEILEVKARVRSLLRAKAYADAVREAQEREMNVAREIQRGILPADLGALAAGSGFELAALMDPAKSVGGDFFEVLRLDEETLLVALGDVMGKGVPASLFMAMSMTLLRALARQHREPGEILRRLNDELGAYNPRRVFVTIACLRIHLPSRTVTGASAGHCPVVLVPAAGEPRIVLKPTGTVAGIFPGRTYDEVRFELAPGDLLLLHSDGVPDAESPANERLLECLAGCGGAAPAEVVARLARRVLDFAAGAPQFDDITILGVRADAGIEVP
jgi:sigma-B regulation protein RsbU (phosphoserine phosphatase)